MLIAIPTYIAMSDGGFTQTSCRDITMHAGAGNREKALSVYQSTWILLLVLALVISTIAIIFSFYAPLNEWLKFVTITRRETVLIS